MTLTQDVARPVWHRRSELEVAAQQLQAITDFTVAQRLVQDAGAAAAGSREMRMDNARALEVLRREHEALVARAHEQLRASGGLLHATAARRVVLAHRNAWFLDKVSGVLEADGWEVAARVENGADAVGVAVAEQPELLLVEDTLAMVPGEQVVREVRQYCPHTTVAAQVAYGDRVGAMLDAGASEVFTRKVPPVEVAARLLELVAV